MIRPATARRIAAAAAYGGGGIGLLTGMTAALLFTEGKIARHTVGEPKEDPPKADGLYGMEFAPPGAKPINFAVMGDSAAAGLGVEEPHETLGALMAAGIASVAERPVRLTCVAKVGARSTDLEKQVSRALEHNPDVAMILVGANDVTHQMSASLSVRCLDAAVRRLHSAGCEAVVGTCPDLGTVAPLPQPLRYILRRVSRRLAAAQTIAVVEAGARTVSLSSLLGPEFEARASELFGPDRFHPSAEGYATVAMAMLPSLCAALNLWPADDEPDSFRGEGILPVAQAAVEAVEEGGTEVAGTRVGGRERGPSGRWALLRHRRRRQLPGMPARTAEVEDSAAQPAGDPADQAPAESPSAGSTVAPSPVPGGPSPVPGGPALVSVPTNGAQPRTAFDPAFSAPVPVSAAAGAVAVLASAGSTDDDDPEASPYEAVKAQAG